MWWQILRIITIHIIIDTNMLQHATKVIFQTKDKMIMLEIVICYMIVKIRMDAISLLIMYHKFHKKYLMIE